MNFSFSTTSTLLLFFSVFTSVFYFTEIYTEIYPILFLISLLLLSTIIKLKRVIFTKKLFTTLFLFFSLILYYSINRDNGIIYELDYEKNSQVNFSITASFIILFFTLVIGYFYSFQYEHPLKIFSKVISIQLITFFAYLLWLIYFKNINLKMNLATGIVVFLFLPYFIIAFNLKKKILLILLYIILMSFLALISNRASMITITMFFINYSIYPYLLKKRILFKAFFFINIFFICFIFFIYLALLDNEILNKITEELFNKRLNTRGFIWIELVEIIKQKYLFGFGSDQLSQYIMYEGEFNRNNLSSHNAFLEIILTGGLLGLLLFIFLFYSIFNQFYSSSINYWGRIGSSVVIGILYSGQTSTFFVTGNIVYNCLFWLFLAVSLGQVIKTNYSNIRKIDNNFQKLVN